MSPAQAISRRAARAGLLVTLVVVSCARLSRAQVPPTPRDRAFLGVNTEPIKKDDPKSGLRVTYLFPYSAAREMGLEVGDEIIALNDTLVVDQRTFVDLLSRESVGATLRFLLRRGGEKVKLKGKIGSRRQTLTRYQESVRERMLGKPLPPLPGVKWWDVATGDWKGKDGLAESKNKLSVIVAFDSCSYCKRYRYDKMSQMHTALRTIQPDAPLEFVGLYQSDAEEATGHDSYAETARAFFAANPPPFAAGLVIYPSGAATPADRDRLVHVHHHGVVILDPAGLVQYVQILDPPMQEFITAYQKLMEKHVPGASKKP